MGQVKISEDVRPISDLKTRTAELVNQVATTDRPVVLTRHGRGVAVLLSVEHYEALLEQLEQAHVARALEVGERDVAAGHVTRHEDVVASWDKRLRDK
jgi:prevent-host-death family protein